MVQETLRSAQSAPGKAPYPRRTYVPIPLRAGGRPTAPCTLGTSEAQITPSTLTHHRSPHAGHQPPRRPPRAPDRASWPASPPPPARLVLGALLALCSALLQNSLKGGLVAVGGLNRGGGIDPVYNAVGLAELAVETGPTTLLMPISARRQLFDLSDEVATRIVIQFYADAREALLKALGE